MFVEQAGLCGICMDEISLIPGSKNFRDVDHDHQTGKVRGLLCHQCNIGLGGFKDSPLRLRYAIHYLSF
jgi:hypothetical protein